MNEDSTSWYHCGRCGSLFQSMVSIRTRRVCTACGRNPLPGEDATPTITLPPRRFNQEEEETEEKRRARRAAQQRKTNILTAKLVVGCLLLMAIIVFASSKLWAPAESEQPLDDLTATLDPTAAEDAKFFRKNLSACQQAFGQFLLAETPEARAQFVVDSSAMAGRMSRHYSQNPALPISLQALTYQSGGVLHLPDGGRAIEIRWSTQEGLRVDSMFFEDDGEWRLDWEHFVRHSDFPWPLFLAGSGEPTGEFRLLARERLSGQDDTSLPLSVVFYQPRQGHPTDTGAASPEFIIERDSPQGILLAEAFAAEKSGKPLFHTETLPVLEPEGFIRVRVKVSREDTEDGRKFRLDQVTARHWLGIATDGPSKDR